MSVLSFVFWLQEWKCLTLICCLTFLTSFRMCGIWSLYVEFLDTEWLWYLWKLYSQIGPMIQSDFEMKFKNLAWLVWIFARITPWTPSGTWSFTSKFWPWMTQLLPWTMVAMSTWSLRTAKMRKQVLLTHTNAMFNHLRWKNVQIFFFKDLWLKEIWRKINLLHTQRRTQKGGFGIFLHFNYSLWVVIWLFEPFCSQL